MVLTNGWMLMFSKPSAKVETDEAQKPATGFREAIVMLSGRVSLDTAKRACYSIASLRAGSESHVLAERPSGYRLYFRYSGDQIPSTEIERAAESVL